MDGGLALICATASRDELGDSALDAADALYWKQLSGFDFSGYSLALTEVAKRSPGADVYLQNDSVLGPFTDIPGLLCEARWRLTGFLASPALENHLQSYAFCLRAVDTSLLRGLNTVFPAWWACAGWRDVINLQETRLARIAARTMTVGSLWFAPCAEHREYGLIDVLGHKLLGGAPAPVRDPGLVSAIALLDEGFPFLKKSLFEKNKGYQDIAVLNDRLRTFGHPVMAASDRDH